MTSDDIAIIALLGVMTGWGEMLSRYGGRTLRLLRMPVAIPYLLVNGLSGVLVVLLLPGLGYFGPADAADVRVAHILTYWLIGATFLRSSLFMFRIGSQDVAIGPAALHQLLLTAADRAVDRFAASFRSLRVSRLMAGVRFDEAKIALPVYCLTLVQNVPQETQVWLGDEIKRLDNAPMDEVAKALSLGLLLSDVVGDDILQAGVEALPQRESKRATLPPQHSGVHDPSAARESSE